MFVYLDVAFHPLSFYNGDQVNCPSSTAVEGRARLEEGRADNVTTSESLPWAPQSWRGGLNS